MAGRRGGPHILDLHDSAPPLIGRPPMPPPYGAHPGGPIDDPRHHPAAAMEDSRRHPVPPLPLRHNPSILAAEDRLAAQHQEIQSLLLDNQRLAATHVALKQEVDAARHELHLAAGAAAKARDGRDAEVREIYKRSARMEVEARSVDGIRAELTQVRADAMKLGASREELAMRLRGIAAELSRAKAEASQSSNIKAEIEAMHHEIQRGRSAVDYEKKVHENNIEQSKVMEQHMTSMARELEQLRAELANAENRARAAAAAAAAAAANPSNMSASTGAVNPSSVAASANAGYAAASYGNPEMAHGGVRYGSDAYNVHQVQNPVPGSAQYSSVASAPHGWYNGQQAQAYR